MAKRTFYRALITGATAGLGEGLAHFFASKKISLLLTGRNREKLAALQDVLSKKTSIKTLQGDLGNKKDREDLIATINEWQPDLVINNAGFGLYGNALDFPLTRQMDILEVNGAASLELTLASVKMFLETNRTGVILNVSSVAGFYVFPGFSVYAASKALVTSFSQSLDYEYKGKGIRVLTACPGPIQTSFATRAADGRPAKEEFEGVSVEQAVEQIWSQITLGQSLRIFDWKYRIAALLASYLPSRFLAPLLHKKILSRKARDLISL